MGILSNKIDKTSKLAVDPPEEEQGSRDAEENKTKKAAETKGGEGTGG